MFNDVVVVHFYCISGQQCLEHDSRGIEMEIQPTYFIWEKKINCGKIAQRNVVVSMILLIYVDVMLIVI